QVINRLAGQNAGGTAGRGVDHRRDTRRPSRIWQGLAAGQLQAASDFPLWRRPELGFRRRCLCWKDKTMAEDPRDWQQETKLVRGGMARSPYGEISEALYLTQSFSYDTAGAADKRFSGEDPGFIYQRFGNPTTQMFEDRLALLEGAEACRAT